MEKAKKSYSAFSNEDIKELGISLRRAVLLEKQVLLTPSDFLLQLLKINLDVPSDSEKAKSELLVTPILNEIRVKNPKKFTFFSGYQFNVDEKRGLKGFCDYIVSSRYDAAVIESPIIAIVEAKHNQDLNDAAPQCIAEMYAADLFNQQNEAAVPVIYGAITTGFSWLFLKYENKKVVIDTERYSIDNLPRLLGALQQIIDSI